MTTTQEKKQLLVDKILAFLPTTFKEPEGVLSHPYISPGGPYSTQLWDWDSYWVCYAIFKIAAKYGASGLRAQAMKYAQGSLFNFLDHQGNDGSIPILMDPTDDDWFDSRKSADNNMAKPFIAQFALLLWENGCFPRESLSERFYQISFFHECYEQRYYDNKTGLFFWANDVAIGVDDDPAVWGRPVKSCASIFLNSFLYQEFVCAAKLADEIRRSDMAEQYRKKARDLSASIHKYCYDKREKSFFSVDIQCQQNIIMHRYYGRLNAKLTPFWNCLPLKILSWNCLLPFWVGIGTAEEMADFVKDNLVADRLLSQYGVRSLSRDEPMYSPEIARGNPSNWLGGLWVIANFIAVETLRKFKFDTLADEVIAGQMKILTDDLEANGYFHEYYSPESGLPVCGDNFVSWTSLAALYE